MKDIVLSPEAPDDGTYEYALLGPNLLRITVASHQVEIYRTGQWLKFGLTGADIREHKDSTLLMAPALCSLMGK